MAESDLSSLRVLEPPARGTYNPWHGALKVVKDAEMLETWLRMQGVWNWEYLEKGDVDDLVALARKKEALRDVCARALCNMCGFPVSRALVAANPEAIRWMLGLDESRTYPQYNVHKPPRVLQAAIMCGKSAIEPIRASSIDPTKRVVAIICIDLEAVTRQETELLREAYKNHGALLNSASVSPEDRRDQRNTAVWYLALEAKHFPGDKEYRTSVIFHKLLRDVFVGNENAHRMTLVLDPARIGVKDAVDESYDAVKAIYAAAAATDDGFMAYAVYALGHNSDFWRDAITDTARLKANEAPIMRLAAYVRAPNWYLVTVEEYFGNL